MQPYVLLHGPAQVGKSTMYRHLKKTRGIALMDAGTPFKCAIGLGIKESAELFKCGLPVALTHFIEHQETLLGLYEARKEADKEGIRDLCIAVAELARMFDPEFWVKACVKMRPEAPGYVGFCLDPVERAAYRRHYEGPIYDVKLDCIDRVKIDDTRKEVPDVVYDFVARYNLLSSHQVAEAVGLMFYDVNPE